MLSVCPPLLPVLTAAATSSPAPSTTLQHAYLANCSNMSGIRLRKLGVDTAEASDAWEKRYAVPQDISQSYLVSPDTTAEGAERSLLFATSPVGGSGSRLLLPSHGPSGAGSKPGAFPAASAASHQTAPSNAPASFLVPPPSRDSLYYAYGTPDHPGLNSLEEFGDANVPGNASGQTPGINADLPPLGSRDAVLFADQNNHDDMMIDNENSRPMPSAGVPPTPFFSTITPIRPVPDSPHPMANASFLNSARQPQQQQPRHAMFGNAVLVFGFPPGDSSVILSRFQKYGEIVSHSIGNGNWLKLEYSTKLAAEQALQQNGKLVRSEYMIGVKPCAAEYDPRLDTTRGSMYTSRRRQNESSFRRYTNPAEALKPQQVQESICARIMAWFMSW